MIGKSRFLFTFGLLTAIMMLGCPPADDNSDDNSEAMPDFALTDLNPASARSGEIISPRDYLDQASAWYFGHAT